MRPPICAICSRDSRDHPELKFDWVRFSDFEAIEGPGHPEGLEWFCADHLEQARRMKDFPMKEAIQKIREEEN